MQNYLKSEVVLVRYPFSDLTSAKVRPAIVVNAPHVSHDLFVVALTSKEPCINSLYKSEVAKPKDTLGVRSAHTLWYVSDEERRQSGWIGCKTVQVIYARLLRQPIC